MKTFQERANQLIQQGNQARAQGRTAEAIAAYTEAIDLVPAYGTLHLVVADMHFEERAYAEAAAAYRKTVAYAPDHDQAWAGLGQCLLLLDDQQGAREAFDNALAHDPENVEANYYGAMLAVLAGDHRKAEQRLLKALGGRPGWEARAREDTLLGPLFKSSRRLSGLGSEKKWWAFWK